MFYVILFLLTAEVLMCWQADEPEKNTIGCSPAVILICVCVCVCLIFDASWCDCTKDWDLDFAPDTTVFQEKALVPGEHLVSASWLRTPNAQFQKADEKDRKWVRSTAA